jgi:hypothetical protein
MLIPITSMQTHAHKHTTLSSSNDTRAAPQSFKETGSFPHDLTSAKTDTREGSNVYSTLETESKSI